ncbi:cytochrome P450 [Saccharopolyspora sp. CA-218241]|uniref:cytochrome P450 n=1 Tax=Saccharopolyspora sp. CA-218241 TaxID=3240027 RepID=UPI003D97BC47
MNDLRDDTRATTGQPPPERPRVMLHGPEFQRRPAELYRQIRAAHGPVAPIELDGGLPAWFVLGYPEICQVTANPTLFSRDLRRWCSWEQVPSTSPIPPSAGDALNLLFTEGAEHQRRVEAVEDVLDGIDPFETRTGCEQIADELVDGFAGDGHTDLIPRFARELPLRVLARLYGLDDGETASLREGLAEGFEGHERLLTRMRGLTERKREHPGPDLPSRLLAHPVALGDEELPSELLLMFTTAHRSVADWVGTALRLILTEPRFATTSTGGPRSVDRVLTEVLWEDAPIQNVLGRVATRDTDLGGQRIRTGDLLVLGVAAANTSPRLRPGRCSDAVGNEAHLAFGRGERGCPHAAVELGRCMARTAVEVLLHRIPDLALAVPAEELTWEPSVWTRSVSSLPVRFTPIPG